MLCFVAKPPHYWHSLWLSGVSCWAHHAIVHPHVAAPLKGVAVLLRHRHPWHGCSDLHPHPQKMLILWDRYRPLRYSVHCKAKARTGANTYVGKDKGRYYFAGKAPQILVVPGHTTQRHKPWKQQSIMTATTQRCTSCGKLRDQLNMLTRLV